MSKSGLGKNAMDSLIPKNLKQPSAGQQKKIVASICLTESLAKDLESAWRDIRELSDKQPALRKVSKSIIIETATKHLIGELKKNKDNADSICKILGI